MRKREKKDILMCDGERMKGDKEKKGYDKQIDRHIFQHPQ